MGSQISWTKYQNLLVTYELLFLERWWATQWVVEFTNFTAYFPWIRLVRDDGSDMIGNSCIAVQSAPCTNLEQLHLRNNGLQMLLFGINQNTDKLLTNHVLGSPVQGISAPARICRLWQGEEGISWREQSPVQTRCITWG